MFTIEILNRTLLISAILLAIGWVAVWTYKKFGPVLHTYFYLLSVEIIDKQYVVRVESPNDNFDISIYLKAGSKIAIQKNARLKAGINKIFFTVPSEIIDKIDAIELISSDQKLEKKI